MNDPVERARIEKYGQLLNIQRAVENNEVRVHEGRCVFLDHDLLCRIHKEYGFNEKPKRCQQFPIKVASTETQQLRVGVDPGCANTYRSWKTGREQEPADPIVRQANWYGPDPQIEAVFLRASAHPKATIGGMLQLMAGLPMSSSPELPPQFASRLIQRAHAARLRQFIHHPELGWGMRSSLEHIPDCVDTLDPEHPPTWPPAGFHQEAFAMEVLRRTLFLRFAPITPASQGLSLLLLSGAVLAAWADPSEKAFGEALAVWSRIIRIKALWFRFFPDPATMRWLAMGV